MIISISQNQKHVDREVQNSIINAHTNVMMKPYV